MNNCRYWRSEVELHTRNVLEVFPKTDDFPGKLEKHAPPCLSEFEATSTEVKLFLDSSETIPAMPRTFEARTGIPGGKAESNPPTPLHSSDARHCCAALIASKRGMRCDTAPSQMEEGILWFAPMIPSFSSTFYRIPSKATLEGWDKKTPEGFVFSAKVPRSLPIKKFLWIATSPL